MTDYRYISRGNSFRLKRVELFISISNKIRSLCGWKQWSQDRSLVSK